MMWYESKPLRTNLLILWYLFLKHQLSKVHFIYWESPSPRLVKVSLLLGQWINDDSKLLCTEQNLSKLTLRHFVSASQSVVWDLCYHSWSSLTPSGPYQEAHLCDNFRDVSLNLAHWVQRPKCLDSIFLRDLAESGVPTTRWILSICPFFSINVSISALTDTAFGALWVIVSLEAGPGAN